MERSTILRWVIIGVAVWLLWTYLPKLWGGGQEGGTTAQQPLGVESLCDPHKPCAPEERTPEILCEIKGNRFKAVFTTQGAALKHLLLEGVRYTEAEGDRIGQPIDLVTTPDIESRRPLRFDWREQDPAAKEHAQVKYDTFDWTLESRAEKKCVFTYTDDLVQLRRVIRASDRPFELDVEATIKNLAKEKKKHQLSVEVVSWRYESEVGSTLGRRSPFMTTVDCEHDGDTERMMGDDFEADDFKDAGFEGGWFVSRGKIDFAAVSNFYFSHALVPEEPAAESCRLQIEERWNVAQFKSKGDDPQAGAMYRARLGYAPRELDHGASATYRVLAFLGPKERDVLAGAAGGQHRLSELVDLGYFSIIAKLLLQFLVWVQARVGNWGIAIILMTICVRLVLAPLTWKQIRSGLAMRMLKPEIDEINKKYKDDPQQKNVATMGLWKKHKVNPIGGCLPALFQLPVWWALFTSLQTAVELYHTPFLWFSDLSAPDRYYIIPVILGGTMILQQRMMPLQMDPMQQKMMTYVMPAVFTVMMLFLPSGLAVYMLTNAVLGIGQQLAIEKYWKKKAPPSAKTGDGIKVIEKPGTKEASPGGKKRDGARDRKGHSAGSSPGDRARPE